MTNVTRAVPAVSPHKNLGVNIAGAGATTLVAAVANAKYRVLGVSVITNAANTVYFSSNTTAISATFPLGTNGGMVLPFNEHGWFETNFGEALELNTTAATTAGVQIHYIVLAKPE